MHNIVPAGHLNAARGLKAAFSRVQRNRDLITVGAYSPGADPQLDHSLALYPKIENLLQQSMLESASFDEALAGLQSLFPNEFKNDKH